MLFYFIIAYLAIINIVAAAMCSYDKSQARISGKRISEYNLFVVSIIGGAPAMYLAMRLTKHKTRKKKFKYGIPLIIFIQVLLALFIVIKF